MIGPIDDQVTIVPKSPPISVNTNFLFLARGDQPRHEEQYNRILDCINRQSSDDSTEENRKSNQVFAAELSNDDRCDQICQQVSAKICSKHQTLIFFRPHNWRFLHHRDHIETSTVNRVGILRNVGTLECMIVLSLCFKLCITAKNFITRNGSFRFLWASLFSFEQSNSSLETESDASGLRILFVFLFKVDFSWCYKCNEADYVSLRQ